jgi:hypothetical protein
VFARLNRPKAWPYDRMCFSFFAVSLKNKQQKRRRMAKWSAGPEVRTQDDMSV